MCPIDGYFDVPFATAGTKTTVPDGVQSDGTVSYEQGYGPDYLLQPGTPNALDVQNYEINQLLFDITSVLQNWQQNTVAPFITTSMNGGSPYSYPQYAMVLSGGVAYISLAASNTDTPPSAKWRVIGFRARLSANTTFYVSTSGSDSTGSGTSGSPWATTQFAANAIQAGYDLNGFAATVQLSPGTYSSGVTVNGPFTGANGPSSVVFLGDTGSPASYISAVTSSVNFGAYNGAQFTVSGILMSGATSYALNADGGGACINYGNVVFGHATSAHVASGTNARLIALGDYVVAGGSGSHFFSGGSGSSIAANGRNITVTGNPAFSVAFALATNVSSLLCQSSAITGAATGSEYQATLNAIINTNGAGASFFPGNSSGTTATGGQYV